MRNFEGLCVASMHWPHLQPPTTMKVKQTAGLDPVTKAHLLERRMIWYDVRYDIKKTPTSSSTRSAFHCQPRQQLEAKRCGTSFITPSCALKFALHKVSPQTDLWALITAILKVKSFNSPSPEFQIDRYEEMAIEEEKWLEWNLAFSGWVHFGTTRVSVGDTLQPPQDFSGPAPLTHGQMWG